MSGVSVSCSALRDVRENRVHQALYLTTQDRPIAVFYINRDIDEDRREAVQAELENAELEGDRLLAVEGLEVPASLRQYFFRGERLHSKLKPGEVGCYASHLLAHQRILEFGLPYALVLEDDAVLVPSLKRDIDLIVAALPDDWDVVHLSGDPTRAFKPVGHIEQVGSLVRYSRVPTGTVGYLISRRGAQKFLAPVKRYWPVDTDLRRPWLFGLEILGVVPRLISHRHTPTSPIRTLGGRSRRRRGIPLPSSESWTGNPLYCPEGAYFNFRRLGPVWWAYCWLRNSQLRIVRAFKRAPSESVT